MAKPQAAPLPDTVRVKVWDPWIRLVHWGLAALLALSLWSGLTHRMDLHLTSGYAILALLLFRLAWGIVGSDTARFARFLRSPLAGLRHLRGLHRREADTEIGHNAAGGWMVLVMLALLLAQAVSGLFTDDQIFTRGPLARAVSPETSDWFSGLHVRIWIPLVAAVALHLLAVLLYRLLKGQNLVGPMVTGSKRLPSDLVAAAGGAPRMAGPLRAVVVLAAAVAVVWGISRMG